MKTVYISYANEDLQTAISLQNALNSHGIQNLLVDHTTFNPNGDVAADMLGSIKDADALVCIFSKHSNDSNFVSIELNAAVKREKKVFLLKTDSTAIDKKNNFVTANSVILQSNTADRAAAELLAFLQ